MKINIIALQNKNEAILEQITQKYLKQITWGIELIDIKPNKSFSLQEEQKNYEAELLLKKLDRKTLKNIICLDERGKQQTSIEFSNTINNFLPYGQINFLIGGAFGLASKIKERSDFILSLSRMTFPHKFAKLILIEQIYRAYQILNNHPYHK